MTKFPEVEVQLSGNDGNAFAIMGAVTKAMKRAGVSKEDVGQYQEDAMGSESYDALLQTTIKTVTVS